MRKTTIITAIILLFALALPTRATAPLTIEIAANVSGITPGQSVNYTIDVRGTDPLGRTTSVYLDTPIGMTIWHIEAFGADGCIQPSEARAQCVGTISATSGMLMFVSARASTTPRCADYTAHARADDHLNTPADDWLTLPRAEAGCTLTLPMLGSGALPAIPQSPYPGP